MSKPGALAFSAGTILILLATATLQGQEYDFEIIPIPEPPPGPAELVGAEATGINNRGAVVGRYTIWVHTSPGRIRIVNRGFKRHANGAVEVGIRHPLDNVNDTQLTGINDHGEIIGTYERDDGPPSLRRRVGFVLADGIFTDLDLPHPGLRGLNNSGDFTGYYITSQGTQGFVSKGNRIEPVGPAGADFTRIEDMAWDGTLVGCDLWYAFFRGPMGNYLRLQLRPGVPMCATAINNKAGKIAGFFIDEFSRYHGFVYDYRSDLAPSEFDFLEASPPARSNRVEGPIKTIPVKPVDVNLPDAYNTYIYDINADGVIVGSFFGGSKFRGFIARPKR